MNSQFQCFQVATHTHTHRQFLADNGFYTEVSWVNSMNLSKHVFTYTYIQLYAGVIKGKVLQIVLRYLISSCTIYIDVSVSILSGNLQRQVGIDREIYNKNSAENGVLQEVLADIENARLNDEY